MLDELFSDYFELDTVTPGTFGHPLARESDEKIAHRVYYAPDATELERHLAERLLCAADYVADELPAIVRDHVESGDDPEAEIAHLEERLKQQAELTADAQRRLIEAERALRAVMSRVRVSAKKGRKTIRVETLAADLGLQ